MIDPTYQSVLYKVVNLALCWGYASSIIKRGAAPMERFELACALEDAAGGDYNSCLPKTHQKSSPYKLPLLGTWYDCMFR